MIEENKKIETETKKLAAAEEQKIEVVREEQTHNKKGTKKSDKKKETPKIKKYEAVSFGRSLPISKKHGMYICSFIKGKKIDAALAQLAQVKEYKRAIPFKGEIPHRKGKGMMSGRYPISAVSYFIPLLKGLRGNAIVNGLDLEKTRIAIASTNWASRPARSGGRKAKRAHVILKAKEFSVKNKNKKKEENK